MPVAVTLLCEGAAAVGALVRLRAQVDAYVIDRVAKLSKFARAVRAQEYLVHPSSFLVLSERLYQYLTEVGRNLPYLECF